MPLRFARRQLRRHARTVRHWIVVQDRRMKPRDRFCSDTRASQYWLAIVGGTISLLMLAGEHGLAQINGAMDMFVALGVCTPIGVAGLLTSVFHLWCLKNARGCNLACFLCCLCHTAFWSSVFIFSLMLGVWGFNLLNLELAIYALWAGCCLSRRLEVGDCESG